MAHPWAKPLYNSAAWKRLRETALRRDRYTCQICSRRAEEVHHVIELTEENINDRSIALNIDNLQSLCHDCHTILTQREHGRGCGDCDLDFFFNDQGELTKIPPPGTG